MIDGNGLGILRPFFIADKSGRSACVEMQQSAEFLLPISSDDIDIKSFDAILLPGGSAQGMKPYLKIGDCSTAFPAMFSKVLCP